LAAGASFTASANVTGTGTIFGVTEVIDSVNANAETFVYAQANVNGPTCVPGIGAPPITHSGLDYQVSWTAISDPTAQFLIDEATAPEFTENFVETQVNGSSKTFHHDVTTTTTYYYRVKATNCAAGTPDFSGTTRTVVQAPPAATSKNPEVSVPKGTTQPVSIPVFIAGKSQTATFSATTDKPYLKVTPISGTLPTTGTTVTVTAQPGSLPNGTSTGTLKVSATTPSAETTTTNTPISISIVTPVQPGGKDLPPANALVIPAVAHLLSGSGPFQSDVRLTNASGQPANYLVTMAPAGSDATKQSLSTTITLNPQETTALNDIVKNFFGIGATGAAGDVGSGSLEIRPIDSASTLNFATSRLYTTQAIGTFGQFIAAIPFSKFATLAQPIQIPIGGPPAGHTISKLSLQQVSQSNGFRTNFGLAEGSGQLASGTVRIFDDNGNVVKETPFSLNPGEVKQQSLGVDLQDGRIEVEITSQTGAVTAYASVLDNGTQDPYAVAPVDASSISATHYVLPGISEFDNGFSNYHSDVRIFNGGTSDVTATLTFSPFAGFPGAPPQTISIPAGHVAALDNILPTKFGVSQTGGSVILTTPSPSSLVATANTYSKSASGTFGQFIPGVISTDGIGVGDAPLQILQLEQSDRFRSNIGLAETTGNPVTVEVELYQPDKQVSPFIEVPLNANEFVQRGIPQLFGNPDQMYNARVIVHVKSGTGRVTAYGSVIDNQSSDATYVPAQK
ncbi:MAG TPA: hypothetical protein VLU46_01305, partial [Thermoanaerobaculia bacterium]|nr:hypothetical protein [Thermoanaerobaculia bacterium]